MKEEKRRERDFIKKLPSMNYTGKIKSTDENAYGNKIVKFVEKKLNGKTYCYTIVYEIRSHKIELPFKEKDEEVEKALRYGKTIAKEMLDEEMQELIEQYIEITIKDIEINCLYTNNWQVLTRSDGSIYRDINDNVILVKYYRVTPTSEFLARYHSIDELEKMSKKEDN